MHAEAQGDARDERLAHNEHIFRSVNERIEQQALRFGGLDAYEFICECATTQCFERLELTVAQYEDVRRAGATFVVAPGHVYDEIEVVIERQSGHWVVRKDGPAGVVAEFDNPREEESE